MLKSKNQKIDAYIFQLKKDLRTQREQQAKLSKSTKNASSCLNSSTRRYTNAVLSSNPPRNIDDLRAESKNDRFIFDAMSLNLADKDNQVDSLSKKMSEANDTKEANKQKISLLNSLTKSSRISGG